MTHNEALNLRDQMFQVSRRCCGKDWEEGTEFQIWSIIEGKADPKSYGIGLADHEVAAIKKSYEEARVWWMLVGDHLEMVSLEDWLDLLTLEAAE